MGPLALSTVMVMEQMMMSIPIHRYAQPDLIASTTADASVCPGGQLAHSMSVTNQSLNTSAVGTYEAPSLPGSSFTWVNRGLATSPDGVSGQINLGFFQPNLNLAPGATYSQNSTTTIPTGTPPGNYYFAVYADSNIAYPIDESREDNNTGTTAPGQVTVLSPTDPDCGGVPDTDGDGISDDLDNCPTVPNGPIPGQDNQLDTDEDGVGNACDAFPDDPTETLDSDGDGLGDNAEAADGSDPTNPDTDLDGINDPLDNCPLAANGPLLGPNNQADNDLDGYGDVCDADDDNDGILDDGSEFEVPDDNCPFTATTTSMMQMRIASAMPVTSAPAMQPTSVIRRPIRDQRPSPRVIRHRTLTVMAISDIDDNCPTVANANQSRW